MTSENKRIIEIGGVETLWKCCYCCGEKEPCLFAAIGSPPDDPQFCPVGGKDVGFKPKWEKIDEDE